MHLCLLTQVVCWPSGDGKKLPVCVVNLVWEMIKFWLLWVKSMYLLSYLNTHNGQQPISVLSLSWKWSKIGSTGHEIATEIAPMRLFYSLWESSNESSGTLNKGKYSWPFFLPRFSRWEIQEEKKTNKNAILTEWGLLSAAIQYTTAICEIFVTTAQPLTWCLSVLIWLNYQCVSYIPTWSKIKVSCQTCHVV